MRWGAGTWAGGCSQTPGPGAELSVSRLAAVCDLGRTTSLPGPPFSPQQNGEEVRCPADLPSRWWGSEEMMDLEVLCKRESVKQM